MPIKVIQVGVGGFGTTWRHTLSTTPGVEVVALVDIDRDILRDAAQFFGMPEERCFLNPDETWPNIEADVVIDSTPQLHHHTHAMQVFAGGKHLIVVKPMSDQWDTGVAMVSEAEWRGRKMVVAQQLRFHPVIMKIREMVQSGALGHVGYIHQDAFFGKKGYGGSYPQPYPVLVQGAIHFFDYLRWAAGSQHPHFARCNQPVESLQALFQRCIAIVRMSIVEVDCIGAKSPQAVFAHPLDLCSAQSPFGIICGYRKANLGGDEQPVPISSSLHP